MGEQLQRGDSAVADPPRRGLRRLLVVVAIAVLVAGAILYYWYRRERGAQSCEEAALKVTHALAVTICQAEYERTRSPSTGAQLANSYFLAGNQTAAAALANELLVTDARADALYILGMIATTQRRLDAAATTLEEARRLHRDRGQRSKVAKDALAMAKVHAQRAQYVEALRAFDECTSEAHGAPDTLTEGYCHLAAARVLSYVGHFEAALHAFRQAEPQLAAQPRDMAWLRYERGNLFQRSVYDPQHSNQNWQAVAEFEQALSFATQAQLTELVLAIHLNLAYSFAEVSKFENAKTHLEEAGILDRDRRYENDRSQLMARIAFRSGDFPLAASINERVYPAIDNDDDKIVVAVMQARIALASNDLEGAARWARRGVETAEKMRRAQPTELRPWVLASRREPFEVLFQALATAGHVEDAVGVFDQWQGRTLLDAMAAPSPDSAQRLTVTADKVSGLERWLPIVSNAPLMEVDRRAVLETLRRIDLIAFAVAKGDVWRLTASRGKLRLENLGKLDELEDDLGSFENKPADRDHTLADQLGKRLLPEDVVRATDDPLYIVLDAPFDRVPFVALRHGGRPLIAVRPVLRTPRFPTGLSCALRPGIGSAVVIGDADAKNALPAAGREASYVATLFKTTARIREDATSQALFSAKPDALLHVAVHADVRAGGGLLELHDRTLLAPEIVANRVGPALVVLAGCRTTEAKNPELTDSLATAFLAGGSGHVIATLRNADDEYVSKLIQRFYEVGGASDPVRVLARVQAELVDTENTEWPNFAVLGTRACLP